MNEASPRLLRNHYGELVALSTAIVFGLISSWAFRSPEGFLPLIALTFDRSRSKTGIVLACLLLVAAITAFAIGMREGRLFENPWFRSVIIGFVAGIVILCGRLCDMDRKEGSPTEGVSVPEGLSKERELSQLMDMVPSYIWQLSPQGESRFFNRRLVEFLGLDPASMERSARQLWNLTTVIIHPDDVHQFSETLSRCLQTGQSFAMTYRLRRHDGVYRWMSGNAEPQRDSTGNIVQWYGLCSDIDDQLQLDEALRKSTSQLQRLIDTVPAMIWSVNGDGYPTYLNKQYVDVTGTTLEEARGRDGLPSLNLVHEEDRADASETIAASLKSGEPFMFRHRQRQPDGGFRWIETRVKPLLQTNGEVLQWYGVNFDIDDLVKAQEALRETGKSLRQLVETLPALIFCSSSDGSPIYRSQQLEAFLGMKLDENNEAAVGGLASTLDSVIHPDDLDEVRKRYGDALRTGNPYAFRHRLRRFDGSYRWVETRAAAMWNAEGIVQWNGVCIDIDDGVKAQEELDDARVKLARASQAASLAELSASIAHEIGQPLAALTSSADACVRWLTAGRPNLERAQNSARRVIAGAEQATAIVKRIRALFHHAADIRVPFSLGVIASEARDLLADEVARSGVRLSIEVEVDLPLVAVDRIQIQQVFVNVMRNAIEAMTGDTEERLLAVKIRRVAGTVETLISDTGPGIEFPPRILEPFFTTKADGMGMGLAICRSIVEAHYGEFRAENNLTSGATFAFTIPLDSNSV